MSLAASSTLNSKYLHLEVPRSVWFSRTQDLAVWCTYNVVAIIQNGEPRQASARESAPAFKPASKKEKRILQAVTACTRTAPHPACSVLPASCSIMRTALTH